MNQCALRPAYSSAAYRKLMPTAALSSAAYSNHEQEKHHAYEERACEVEHGCFTPLVFSTSGGMGKVATIVYKCLANL